MSTGFRYTGKAIGNRRKHARNRIFPGAFPAWDNTPRRGIHADVFWKATPDKFKAYFAKQMKHAKNVYHAEYIFINAWNEWGGRSTSGTGREKWIWVFGSYKAGKKGEWKPLRRYRFPMAMRD